MATATYTGTLDPADEFPNDYYQDIPARDLTDEDYALLTPDQQALVQVGSLYIFHP